MVGRSGRLARSVSTIGWLWQQCQRDFEGITIDAKALYLLSAPTLPPKPSRRSLGTGQRCSVKVGRGFQDAPGSPSFDGITIDAKALYLLEAAEEAPQHQWLSWLETEFAWSERTAGNYMQVAEAFKS